MRVERGADISLISLKCRKCPTLLYQADFFFVLKLLCFFHPFWSVITPLRLSPRLPGVPWTRNEICT
jgi:hypothetical protein